MRRSLIALAAFLLFPLLPAFSQPVPLPITGNLGQITGQPSAYSVYKLSLQNCSGGIPQVTGYSTIVPTAYQFVADTNGNINGTVWPNDLITCASTTGATQWAVTVIADDIPVGTVQCFQVTHTQGAWNINTQQPVTCGSSPPNPQDGQFVNMNITGCLSVLGGPCFPPTIPSYVPPGTGVISAALSGHPTGQFIQLSCGTYYDNVVLDNVSGIRIQGASSGYGGIPCTVLIPNTKTSPAISIESTGIGASSNFVTIAGISFQCPTGIACNDGILVSGYTSADQGMNYLDLHDDSFLGDISSATTGFSKTIEVTGGLISAALTQIYSNNGMVAGLSVTGSNPVNDFHCDRCVFQQSYGDGVYWNKTSGTPPASISFVHSVFEYNGNNTSGIGTGSNCAGFYANGLGSATIDKSYFEGNCEGNTSGTPTADLRLTGTYNQAFTVTNTPFFADYSEWGIYNDTTQTAGDYEGNYFSDAAKSVYISTSSTNSQISLGVNFNMQPTIVPDSLGSTHVSSDSPTGKSVCGVNSVTSNTLPIGNCDTIELSGGPWTINSITGGYPGRVVTIRALTGNQVLNTSGSGATAIRLLGAVASETVPSNEAVTLEQSVFFNKWEEQIPSSNFSATSLTIQGGTPATSTSSANSQIVTCPPGGTSTEYCGADGAWHAGGSVVFVTSFTSTAATSDPVTVTGMTSSGHCAQPAATNSSAATNIATTYISAKTTNQITITHTATAGMTWDIICTPN